MKKTVGIIGGMGPLATCDLYQKIISATKASNDQAHLHVIIDSNTDIPDRTAAILNHKQDPVKELSKSACRLIDAGAEVLCMPCNTAHYFYSLVNEIVRSKKPDVKFINMLCETARYVKLHGFNNVGLLATDGTVQSKVYERAFRAEGIHVELPSPKGQACIMHLIYDGIKAGNPNLDISSFRWAIDELMRQGAQTLILGCTELPVAFQQHKFDYPSIDPTTVLAKAVVLAAGAEVNRLI